jgi:hypothetical protein
LNNNSECRNNFEPPFIRTNDTDVVGEIGRKISILASFVFLEFPFLSTVLCFAIFLKGRYARRSVRSLKLFIWGIRIVDKLQNLGTSDDTCDTAVIVKFADIATC